LPCSEIEVTKNTLDAQTIIQGLESQIVDHYAPENAPKDNYYAPNEQQVQLRQSIGRVVISVGKMVVFLAEIFSIKGKSVRVVFEEAGLVVPLGF
jgi:hypothetical protein